MTSANRVGNQLPNKLIVEFHFRAAAPGVTVSGFFNINLKN